MVVTIASAVYFRYGRSVQYEQYLVQARDARAQAVTLTDAVAQREAWQRELFYLDKAEDYTETGETRDLRLEAQQKLDEVLGIRRLQFQPVLSRSVGAQIGRLAARRERCLSPGRPARGCPPPGADQRRFCSWIRHSTAARARMVRTPSGPWWISWHCRR